MASDDEEYLPSDLDEEAFLNQAYGTDEEAYLLGATTGEDDDDEDQELFGEGTDPVQVLAGMQEQQALGRQPFQLLASQQRRNQRERQAVQEAEEEEEEGGAGPSGAGAEGSAQGPSGRRARGNVFGPAVEDIFNESMAEQLGLMPAKSRKKQRAKARWRKQAEKKGTRRRELPEAVAAKLGEANLLYAAQRHHEAIALLTEVIRLAPNLPDPYHTLALLHEAVGDTKKSLDCYMLAAHLTPKDIALWRRLAQTSSEQGLVAQAIYCLTHVLRRDKTDLDARYDRAMLYAELEDNRKAIEGLKQVQEARPDHAEVPKALARLYHRTGQAARAKEVLLDFMASHPQQADLTHANILAELYCEACEWAAALALVQRAEKELLGPGEDLPIDLRVKAGTALMFLGDIEGAAGEFAPILQEPVESFGDLYLDAGHVLMAAGHPDRALPFLSALAEHPEAGSPEAWSRLALCHRALGDVQAALKVYQGVVGRLAPNHPGHIEATVALADLHRELGQQAEAERVLADLERVIRTQDMPADHAAALEFVLRRAEILFACGKNEAYLDVTMPVLGATLRALEAEHRQVAGEADARLAARLKYLGSRPRPAPGSGEPEGVFVGYKRHDRRKKHVRELDERAEQLLAQTAGGAMSGAESEGEEEAGPGAFVMPELLWAEAPFMMLIQTGKALLAEQQPQAAREVLQAALDVCSKRWADKWKKDALRLLMFEACLDLRDFPAAMAALRPVAARWPHACLVWNGFTRYFCETGAVRAALKFLTPLRGRHPTSLPLMLMLGHCHLLNLQYAEALGQYFHAYRLAPCEPLVLLCISAALVNQAATKRVPDRHRAVLQAFAFLQEYGDARCNPQEAAYNVARAAHHLGLLHIAVPYYQRALDTPPPPGAASAGATCDVRREAAYNLSLIYRQSGADALAKQLLRQHLTI